MANGNPSILPLSIHEVETGGIVTTSDNLMSSRVLGFAKADPTITSRIGGPDDPYSRQWESFLDTSNGAPAIIETTATVLGTDREESFFDQFDLSGTYDNWDIPLSAFKPVPVWENRNVHMFGRGCADILPQLPVSYIGTNMVTEVVDGTRYTSGGATQQASALEHLTLFRKVK